MTRERRMAALEQQAAQRNAERALEEQLAWDRENWARLMESRKYFESLSEADQQLFHEGSKRNMKYYREREAGPGTPLRLDGEGNVVHAETAELLYTAEEWRVVEPFYRIRHMLHEERGA